MTLAALVLLSETVGAATSPTVTATDRTGRPTATSASLVRDGDLSIFFPEKQRDGNAASAYVRAFEIFNADRDRVRYRDKWDVLLERRSMRAALEQITSGALCKPCDFLPLLPDDLSRSTKFPYLVETQVLAKLLAVRADRELAAKQREAALATARTLMAFGRHLRGSALVLTQDIQGIAIERLAVDSLWKGLGREADAVTSAKLTAVELLLDTGQGFIADAITSHSAKGTPSFSDDLGWLQSPYAVLRCEAILNMAQATLPSSVLVKPTPAIDLYALARKLDAATTASKLKIQRSDVEARIQWPRKGVRSDVLPEDVRRVREILTPLAQSDPEQRVRVLAQRLLDALIEPKPTPVPPKSDRPTTPTRPPLRPPRPAR
jgi:hypothetical protein